MTKTFAWFLSSNTGIQLNQVIRYLASLQFHLADRVLGLLVSQVKHGVFTSS